MIMTDEIVFTNPTEPFYRMLMLYKPMPPRPSTSSSTTSSSPHTVSYFTLVIIFSKSIIQEHYTLFDDERDITVLTSIHDHLAKEIESKSLK